MVLGKPPGETPCFLKLAGSADDRVQIWKALSSHLMQRRRDLGQLMQRNVQYITASSRQLGPTWASILLQVCSDIINFPAWARRRCKIRTALSVDGPRERLSGASFYGYDPGYDPLTRVEGNQGERS
jgi:hypothetical protein